MMRKSLFCLFYAASLSCCAQNSPKNLLDDLLESRPDLFQKVLSSPETYEVQIIYTQINRDADNQPSFVSFPYRVDAQRYFYPASTVKFPAVLLALEKMKQLGLPPETSIRIDSVRSPQKKVDEDTTAANGLPSVAHYIKKILLVSDNDAFNRLYEFLGQAYINENLWRKGYKDVLITHRLATSDYGPEENRYTNPMEFYQGDSVLYRQEEVFNPKTYSPKVKNPYKGTAYVDNSGKLIRKPFDFSQKNYFSLEEMHEMLKAVIFPEAVPPRKRFDLRPEDYNFLYQYMSMFPEESQYPNYKDGDHYDAYVKFILFGESKEPIPSNIRVFNKVGLAYGFLVENAYVVDFEAKTEFLISAVIYTNQNQVLNDSKYEYKEIGFPFMANLGQVIAWHEKQRPRKYLPDLNRFQFDYQNIK